MRMDRLWRAIFSNKIRKRNREIGNDRAKSLLAGLKNRGSYTVEAAFVVPIILGLAFVILFTLFLLHDKAVLQANLDNVIFLMAEGEKIEKEELNTHLSRALWYVDIYEITIKNRRVLVSGKVKAAANLNILVLSFFINGKEKFILAESYYKIQPEQVQRFGKGILRGKNDT